MKLLARIGIAIAFVGLVALAAVFGSRDTQSAMKSDQSIRWVLTVSAGSSSVETPFTVSRPADELRAAFLAVTSALPAHDDEEMTFRAAAEYEQTAERSRGEYLKAAVRSGFEFEIPAVTIRKSETTAGMYDLHILVNDKERTLAQGYALTEARDLAVHAVVISARRQHEIALEAWAEAPIADSLAPLAGLP